ncbi:flagellar assembly protein FliH [Castellaniella caeni]|uniref:flagellar assembly protein FliH n=1 Tax=Castellaniella caeni TaxID=266123 RepID=UPI0011AFB66E|nr:flagellar assembly protein FliH [Castellaniella caeni]
MTSTSEKPSSSLQARARWQRWEMDSLEARQRAQNRRVTDSEAHRAELARQRTQALAEAREEGLRQGYQAGFEQGEREGRVQGQETGRQQGHAQGLDEGRAEGHALGLAQAQAEGRALVQEQAAQLAHLAQACATALNQLEAEVGQSLISLATRIAEQVLHTQLQAHPGHVLALVEDVMRARPEPGTALTLRLHPDDVALVEAFLAQNPDFAGYRLVADERITRGGCIAETALGSVDATLETRWHRIISALGQKPAKP